MWRNRKPRASKELTAKGLYISEIYKNNYHLFCIVEIAALIEAAQVSEQGNLYLCVSFLFDYL